MGKIDLAVKERMTLANYKSASNVLLSKLQSIIHKLQIDIKELDRDFPSWKEGRQKTSWPQHEARRELLISVRTVVENAFLNYIFIRDYLTEESWWSEKLTEVSLDKVLSAVKEQAIMTKWFLFHAVAMALEETLRSVVRSAPGTFTVSASAKFQSIYRQVLKVANQQHLEPLFEVLRLTRNTLHTNGFFFPPNNKDVEITYQGERFAFEVGQQLKWLGEEALVWLLEKVREAVVTIVRSPAIASVKRVPRGQSYSSGS